MPVLIYVLKVIRLPVIFYIWMVVLTEMITLPVLSYRQNAMEVTSMFVYLYVILARVPSDTPANEHAIWARLRARLRARFSLAIKHAEYGMTKIHVLQGVLMIVTVVIMDVKNLIMQLSVGYHAILIREWMIAVIYTPCAIIIIMCMLAKSCAIMTIRHRAPKHAN